MYMYTYARMTSTHEHHRDTKRERERGREGGRETERMAKEYPVYVYVYDLSQGMARMLSGQLLGQQIDGIWHTGESLSHSCVLEGVCWGLQRARQGVCLNRVVCLGLCVREMMTCVGAEDMVMPGCGGGDQEWNMCSDVCAVRPVNAPDDMCGYGWVSQPSWCTARSSPLVRECLPSQWFHPSRLSLLSPCVWSGMCVSVGVCVCPWKRGNTRPPSECRFHMGWWSFFCNAW